MSSQGQRATTLRDYLHVLRRRKWIVIVPVVLAPIIAGVLAHRQPKLYKASSQVTVSQADLPSSVVDLNGSTQEQDPVRLLATQAQFARLPAVAQRAVNDAGVPNESGSDLLAASTVTPSQTDDFLTFTVADAQRRPGDASRERVRRAVRGVLPPVPVRATRGRLEGAPRPDPSARAGRETVLSAVPQPRG